MPTILQVFGFPCVSSIMKFKSSCLRCKSQYRLTAGHCWIPPCCCRSTRTAILVQCCICKSQWQAAGRFTNYSSRWLTKDRAGRNPSTHNAFSCGRRVSAAQRNRVIVVVDCTRVNGKQCALVFITTDAKLVAEDYVILDALRLVFYPECTCLRKGHSGNKHRNKKRKKLFHTI